MTLKLHARTLGLLAGVLAATPLHAGAVPPPPAPTVFTAPLPGLTAAELARFNAGLAEFDTQETPADGLGPIFNGPSSTPSVACASCHFVGGSGGGSDVLETRFGQQLPGGGFDPLAQLGGSLLQLFAIPGFPQEVVPPTANVTAQRRSIPLFGLGLVDAVPDGVFVMLARMERAVSPSTAGRVSFATSRATQQPVVAKFGWKAQVSSLLEFSANAYVNEMGITSPLFPIENCPSAAPGTCNDAVPDPEDAGGVDVALFHDFITFLAPPPRGAITPAARRGNAVFLRIGCANCHTPMLMTGPSPSAALSHKLFQPYSDFLLHDMGSLADGIGGNQADASGIEAVARGSEMRTQPLWGVRILDRFLHDGRARTLEEAILFHDGQGAGARDAFLALRPNDQADLIAFLKSL